MSFLKTIGIVIGLAIIIILLINHFIIKSNIIYDDVLNVQNHKDIIKSSDLPKTNSSNFTMSVWFYINDWQHNYGKEKNIMFLAKTPDAKNYHFSNDLDSINKGDLEVNNKPKNYKNLSLYLGEFENDLFLEIETFKDTNNNINSKNNSKNNSVLETTSISEYKIPNVELQKWVCLTISVDTRTMDVYLDGKLVNSYILPGTYKPSIDNNMYLGDLGEGSFGGFLTRVRYLKNDISPEESYKIYKDGINSSALSGLLNKYRLKVSFLEYNTPVKSFTI